MPAPTHEPLLTVREAAQLLKVSQETIRRRIRTGELPACKLGSRAIRINRDDLSAIAEPASCPESLEAHIASVVAKAPPLSPEQRDRLSMLFRSPGGAAA